MLAGTWGRVGLAWAPHIPAHPVCDRTLTPVPSVAVRYFLKNKVSPDLCNEDGLTALHQVRLGLLGSPLPAPHLYRCPIPLHFPAQNPQGGGGEGELQLPHLKGSCLLWRCMCLLQTPTEPLCTRAWRTPSLRGQGASVHCILIASKGLINKASLFGA